MHLVATKRLVISTAANAALEPTDVRFRGASITKLVTSALIPQLVDGQTLALDDTLD